MMRNIIIIITLFSFVGILAQTKSKTPATTPSETPQALPNPVEVIMSESEGNIDIDIPDDIMVNITQNLSSSNGVKGNNVLKTGVNRLNGYRIQVFSDGRNQSTLESRARARGNLILNKFPKYKGQIYTFSNSPNWYCRVGNFRSSEEANEAMAELRRAFPNFSTEMRIVKSPIVIIKQ